MSDLNREAMSIWNALKPMIDMEIESKSRGVVHRRKAKVTTAPSLVSNKIGVTEPFSNEVMLPFVTNMISATVGDVVWIEYMYGASNSFVSSFASVDDKDFNVARDFEVYGDSVFHGSMTFDGPDGFLYRMSNSVAQKQLYKTLWTGSWSSDDITVTGFSDYKMFALSIEGYTAKILATLSDDGLYLNGIGGYVRSSSSETAYYISAAVSGNTLTMEYCHSRTSGGSKNDCAISQIIGII